MALPAPKVTLRVPPRLLRRIDALAEYHSISRTHVILLAVHALATPHGQAHRQFNALRDAYDRRGRRR